MGMGMATAQQPQQYNPMQNMMQRPGANPTGYVMGGMGGGAYQMQGSYQASQNFY